MGGRIGLALALGGLLPVAPALGQDRSFCAERPGMGKPACTLESGQKMIEVTAFVIDHIATDDGAVDTLSFADTLLRYGLDENTELQLGVTGYVRTLEPDPANPNSRIREGGVGDSYIALRHRMDGAGPIAAIEAYVTLPTGAKTVSSGTWGAGIVLPMDLGELGGLSVSLTPEIGALPNATGRGRHLLYGAVLGVSGELARNLGGALELAGDQEDAPEGASFSSKIAGSLAWQASDRLQFNVEVDIGLIAPQSRTLAMVGFALRL